MPAALGVSARRSGFDMRPVVARTLDLPVYLDTEAPAPPYVFPQAPRTPKPAPPVNRLSSDVPGTSVQLKNDPPPLASGISRLLANLRASVPCTVMPQPEIAPTYYGTNTQPHIAPAAPRDPQPRRQLGIADTLRFQVDSKLPRTAQPRRQCDIADTLKFQFDSSDSLSTATPERPNTKDPLADTFKFEAEEIFGFQERLTGEGLTESPIDFSPYAPAMPLKKRQVAVTLSLPVFFEPATETAVQDPETHDAIDREASRVVLNPVAKAPDESGCEKIRLVAKTLSLPAFFNSAVQSVSVVDESLDNCAENLARSPQQKRARTVLHVGPRPGSLSRPIADIVDLAPGADRDANREPDSTVKPFRQTMAHVVICQNAQTNKENEQRGHKIQHNSWLRFLLFAVCLICTFQAFLHFDTKIAAKLEAPEQIDLNGAHLESCDRRCSINFVSDKSCQIEQPGTSISAAYRVVSNTVDALALLNGFLAKREFWYHCSDGGVIEHNGVVMYPANSPELKIVSKMRWYADFAQEQYRETKLYPADAEQCKQADSRYEYINPFTNQTDYATIVFQHRPDNDLDLTNLLTTERQYRPGAIICQCINNNIFVVQGFDRSGRLLTSSEPGYCFSIECRNGEMSVNAVPKKKIDDKHDFCGKQTDFPAEAIVCASPDLEPQVQWLRRICQIILWSLCVAASLFCYFSHKTAASRKARLLSIVGCSAAFLLLFVCYKYAGWHC